MSINASRFISSRSQITSITDGRIKSILWYVVECYKILQKDNPQYSKKHVEENTSLHFEDYLKVELVDTYLIENKHLLEEKLSALEEVNFTYESEKRYTDSTGKQKKDKIDIYINKLGLKDHWNTADEHIYYVLECKRILSLSSSTAYVGDIEKFCSRNYLQLRLPFEGMIGFIENKTIKPNDLAIKVNEILDGHADIKTSQKLTLVEINSGYNGSYKSSHTKNFAPNDAFSIYHLFLDYSNQVVV